MSVDFIFENKCWSIISLWSFWNIQLVNHFFVIILESRIPRLIFFCKKNVGQSSLCGHFGMQNSKMIISMYDLILEYFCCKNNVNWSTISSLSFWKAEFQVVNWSTISSLSFWKAEFQMIIPVTYHLFVIILESRIPSDHPSEPPSCQVIIPVRGGGVEFQIWILFLNNLSVILK